MNSKVIKIIIYAVLILAILGAAPLVKSEMEQGHICPQILGIPACYLVMVCFVFGFLAHIFNFNRLYFISIGVVTSIALFGTMGELFDIVECPRTASGIPMCFISLSICFVLLFSKLYQINKNEKQHFT